MIKDLERIAEFARKAQQHPNAKVSVLNKSIALWENGYRLICIYEKRLVGSKKLQTRYKSLYRPKYV